MVSIMVAHPVKIVNNTGTAVSNYQQMVVAPMCNNCANASVSNIFWAYDPAGASIIPSWLESQIGSTVAPTNANSGSLIYWLKITGTIPAGATQTVYMIFADRGTTVWDGTLTGVAPYWTPAYGQYDNGKNVFGMYDNFLGASLSSQWTIINSPTITVNNGITVSGNSSVSGGIALNTKYSFPAILEAYSGKTWSYAGFMFMNDINGNPYSVSSWFTAGSSTGQGYNGMVADPWGTNSGGNAFIYVLNGKGYFFGTSVASLVLNSIVTIYSSGSTVGQLINYGNTNSQSTSISLPSTTYNIEIGAANNYSISLHWIRYRAYPPNGVMPAVLF